MKDLMTRVLLSAVVATLTSAGILYFAFDQALRGVETALNSTTASISQNGEWIRAVDGKIDTLSDRLSSHGREMDNGFSDLKADISLGRNTSTYVLQRTSGYTQILGTTLDNSIGTTAQILAAFRATLPSDDPQLISIGAQIDLLVRQLDDQRKVLGDLDRSLEMLQNDAASDAQIIRR